MPPKAHNQPTKPSHDQPTSQSTKSTTNKAMNQSKQTTKTFKPSAGRKDADQPELGFVATSTIEPADPDDIVLIDSNSSTPKTGADPNSNDLCNQIRDDRIASDTESDLINQTIEKQLGSDGTESSNQQTANAYQSTNIQSNKQRVEIPVDDSDDDATLPQPMQFGQTNPRVNQPAQQTSTRDKQQAIDQAIQQAAINQVNKQNGNHANLSNQQANNHTGDITTLPRPQPTQPSLSPSPIDKPVNPSPNANHPTDHQPNVRDSDDQRLYTISYEMAHKLGVYTDEFDKSFELTIATRNTIGDRFAGILELLSITNNLNAARIAEILSTIFNLPFFPTSLLANDDFDSFINHPSITPELITWANTLREATSFDDVKLLGLPITIPSHPDFTTITNINQLFDDRTACFTSFSRKYRDNTVRLRLVFKTRSAMLVLGALIQRVKACINHPSVVELADKHETLLAQPSLFASKAQSKSRSLSIEQALTYLKTNILGENQTSTDDLDTFISQPIIALSLDFRAYKPNSRFSTVVIRGFARAPASFGGHLYIPRQDKTIPSETEALEQINRLVKWNRTLRARDTIVAVPNQLQSNDIYVTVRAHRVKFVKLGIEYHQVSILQREWDVSNLSVSFQLAGASLCYACHQPGHFAASCPSKNVQTDQSSPSTPACPRCSKANTPNHECIPITSVLCTLCKETGHLTSQCFKVKPSWVQVVKPSTKAPNKSSVVDTSASVPALHLPQSDLLSSTPPKPPAPAHPPVEQNKHDKMLENITKILEQQQQSQRQALETQASINAQLMAQISALNQSIAVLTQTCINLQNNQQFTAQSSHHADNPTNPVARLPNPPGLTTVYPTVLATSSSPQFSPAPNATNSPLSAQPKPATPAIVSPPQSQPNGTKFPITASVSPEALTSPHVQNAIASLVTLLLQTVKPTQSTTPMTQSLNSHIDELRAFTTKPAPPKLIALVEAQVTSTSHPHLNLLQYESIFLPSPSPPEANAPLSGGGTALFYHHSLSVGYLPHISLDRLNGLHNEPRYGRTSSIHWFRITPLNSRTDFILGIVYLSPLTKESPNAMLQVQSNILSVTALYPDTRLLVGGDFNLRSNLWDSNITHEAISQSAHLRRVPSFYHELVNNAELTLLNTHFTQSHMVPTRPASNSVLDLGFANVPMLNNTTSFTIGSAMFADHLPLHVRTTYELRSSSILNEPSLPRWSPHSSNAWKTVLPLTLDAMIESDSKLTELITKMSSAHPISQPDAQELIQSTWTSFTLMLESALDCLPRTNSKRKYYWFTSAVQQQHRTMLMARSRWRRHRNSQHAASLLEDYRKHQALFKQMAKSAKACSMQQLYASILTEPHAPILWSALSRIRPSASKRVFGSIPDSLGNPPRDQQESLDNLCSRFIDQSLPERPVDSDHISRLQAYVNERSTESSTSHPTDSWSWSASQVREQCTFQRNTRSAAGPDGFPPAIMGHLSDSTYAILAAIYSFSWRHAVLPVEWVSGNVFALLKDPSKPINDPSNYRPITVTSIFIRTFEHLIHHRLIPLIKSIPPPNNLNDHQFGFREQRSCMNAAHLLISSIQNEQRVKPSVPLPVIFIDFAKAFDRVSHLHLLYILETRFGISGLAWRWIDRWLGFKRRTRCVSNAFASAWRRIRRYGVPQGAVLSPLLFLLFINLVANAISSICPLIDLSLYADDVALFPKSRAAFEAIWSRQSMAYERAELEREHRRLIQTSSKSKTVAQTKAKQLLVYRELAIAAQLQRALCILSTWLAHVGMSANPAKSKVVIFTALPSTKQHWLHSSTASQYWYTHLQLDGFTLSVANRYEYLGLILDSKLSWKPHIEKVVTKVSNVSALLCRLFAMKDHTPHPLAVIKLIKSLLLPHIEYGIIFWCQLKPVQSKEANDLDRLHSLILKPIRRAFNLPTHSHRLGLLVDCGLTSIHDMANKAVYNYYQRYSSMNIHTQFDVTKLLRSSMYLHTTNLSPAIHPSTAQSIKDAFFDSINPVHVSGQKLWLNICLKARFSTEPALNRTLIRAQSQQRLANLPFVKEHTPHPAITNPAPRRNNIQPINPIHMSGVAQLATLFQWEDQWASNQPQHARKTTAPLTLIKIAPGITPLLRYVITRRVITILMRLRHGRAYTHDTRVRFAKTDQPAPSPLCHHPPCMNSQTHDSVSHLLLVCPRHDQLKHDLLAKWKTVRIGSFLRTINDLSLKLLLGELPKAHNIKYRQQYVEWYNHLSDFIISLYQNLPVNDQCPVPL